jgi:hypothetical protein
VQVLVISSVEIRIKNPEEQTRVLDISLSRKYDLTAQSILG